MRERILKFIESENMSAAKFADEIGVQRSSVSHILSGRNNPSFDFIQKILAKYKQLSAEWLIMGTGNMYKSFVQPSLFDNISTFADKDKEPVENSVLDELNEPVMPGINSKSTQNAPIPVIAPANKPVEKIIILYSDKTFVVYSPEKTD